MNRMQTILHAITNERGVSIRIIGESVSVKIPIKLTPDQRGVVEANLRGETHEQYSNVITNEFGIECYSVYLEGSAIGFPEYESVDVEYTLHNDDLQLRCWGLLSFTEERMESDDE